MIWSRSGTQANIWRNGQRTIQSSVPYEILFEGIVGYSWQGDIALDDITVAPGECPAPGNVHIVTQLLLSLYLGVIILR